MQYDMHFPVKNDSMYRMRALLYKVYSVYTYNVRNVLIHFNIIWSLVYLCYAGWCAMFYTIEKNDCTLNMSI